MDLTIRAPLQEDFRLVSFWAGYFAETPHCTCPDCGNVAVEVDPFFPYLDDLNRCEAHSEALYEVGCLS